MYIDFETQRRNAVENQLRPNGIIDTAVLDAFGKIRREIFVSAQYKGSSYSEATVFCDETERRFLLSPPIFAKTLQAAEITGGDTILDIGCGTGYAAAVMAEMGNTVIASDTDPDYLKKTAENFRNEGISNIVTAKIPDLFNGCPQNAPFNVITLFGCVSEIPRNLCMQLADGGRLLCIVAEGGNFGEAVKITRKGNNFIPVPLFNCTAPYLESRQSRTFSL